MGPRCQAPSVGPNHGAPVHTTKQFAPGVFYAVDFMTHCPNSILFCSIPTGITTKRCTVDAAYRSEAAEHPFNRGGGKS